MIQINTLARLISLCVLVEASAQAATIHWTGGSTSNDWNAAANWSTSYVPGSTTNDSVLFVGTSDSTTLATPFAFTNLSAMTLRADARVTLTEDLSGINQLYLGPNAGHNGGEVRHHEGTISAQTVRVGSSTSATSESTYTASGGELHVAGDLYVNKGTFVLDGAGSSVFAESMSISGIGELNLQLGAAGINPIVVTNTFSINSTSVLTVDATGISTNTGTYELVRYASRSGFFSAGKISVTGLAPGLDSSIAYDADSMNLVVSGEAMQPEGAKVYFPITCTLKPLAGTASQSDDDLVCNGENLGSPNLSCSRSTPGGDTIYSVTFVQDVDGDAVDDTLTFDLRVEGFVGSSYTYSATSGASSVTALGSASDVTDIGNGWGTGGDDEIDPGETLRFSVENIQSTSDSLTYLGMNSMAVKETNAGNSHKHIRGVGSGLDSGIFSAETAAFPIKEADADPFVVTGAGSNVANREWAVTSIAFSFKGALVPWDPTDYSITKVAAHMLNEYDAQTNYANYPEFSWDTVPRWLIVRKNSPAYTANELTAMAGNYEVVVWEKANKAGFSTIEEGIIDASSRLKLLDPTVKSLFYRNTSLHYSGYASDATYDTWNWSRHTTDTNGTEVLDLHKGLYPWYNYNVADMRDWWLNEAALPMILHEPINGVDPIDGVFCDKCIVPTTGYFFDGNGDPVDDYIGTQVDLAQALETHDKLMVGNVIRNERHNGGREYMRFYDGSYLERWNFPYSGSGQSVTDAVCASIQLMREASLKGKMIFFKTGENSAASSLEEMEEDMSYHLALYLMVAEQYSYFAYQDTVNALEDDFQWETSWMPEFSRPLGAPLGGPVKDGYIYSRSFEHVEAWVDVANEESVLAWDSEDSDGDGLDDMWEFRHFEDKTIADPLGNPDGDDLTNAEEYSAGTNPNLPESFEISNLIAAEAVQLEWDAVDGYLYNVYWSSNLVSGFSLIGTNLVEGSFVDTATGQDDQGFYKITVEREP